MCPIKIHLISKMAKKTLVVKDSGSIIYGTEESILIHQSHKL